MIKFIKINAFQKGIYFCDGEPKKILIKGKYWFVNPFKKENIIIASETEPWFCIKQLDIIIKSKIADNYLTVIDLKDTERGLVWIDGRFDRILLPGLYALWNSVKDIKVEIVDAKKVKFEHNAFDTIIKSGYANYCFDIFTVNEGQEGLFFFNGEFVEILKPGQYAFWKNIGKTTLYNKDLREMTLDVSGQEIMTNDKVTLRINALVMYKIKDSLKTILTGEDISSILYKYSQLALRAVIGTKDLDNILIDKDKVADELETIIKEKAELFGLNVTNFGIKDIILPGEMKNLLNKVTEAKKIAEANLITRREEVASMRNQANTAKMLENNPTLMKLKELEVLEKISQNSKLKIILGNEKLSEKVVNLL